MEKSVLDQIIKYDISSKAAICTQVEWRGSVPRKDYPIMIVDNDRKIIGTIGGGALENSTIDLAQGVIKNGNPILKSFDLTNQDVNKDESICGGTTTILIEPFTNDIKYILSLATKNNVLLTIIEANSLGIKRELYSNINTNDLPKIGLSVLEQVQKDRLSKSIKINNKYYLFQYFGKNPTLHIFGAGHVGQAVAELAHFISLDTIIYDERKDLNNIERFPYSKKHMIENVADLLDKIKIDPIDFIIVATRGHKNDFTLMQKLLQFEFSYISLVSSEKKWELLAAALSRKGIPKNRIDLVHSPVGLDIGSETVPEIAVSIISEIINHYRKGTRSELSISMK